MQILFLFVGVIGFGMFVFGMRTLIKNHRSKTIAALDFTENPSEASFEKTGMYAVCIVGGGYARNNGRFDLEITYNGNQLDVFEKQMKPRFHHKGKLSTEFYQFEVEHTGTHTFQFANTADLEVKQSMLWSKRMFQNKLPVALIGIVIKETTSSISLIVGILMAIFGANITCWGFILTFNPQLYV